MSSHNLRAHDPPHRPDVSHLPQSVLIVLITHDCSLPQPALPSIVPQRPTAQRHRETIHRTHRAHQTTGTQFRQLSEMLRSISRIGLSVLAARPSAGTKQGRSPSAKSGFSFRNQMSSFWFRSISFALASLCRVCLALPVCLPLLAPWCLVGRESY